MPYYIILQTKTTKPFTESRGHFRGELWSTSFPRYLQLKERGMTEEQALKQVCSNDGGEAELITTVESGKAIGGVMDGIHSAVAAHIKLIGDEWKNLSTRKQNDQMIEVVRKYSEKKFPK
jgi:hypothetical protein